MELQTTDTAITQKQLDKYVFFLIHRVKSKEKT